MSLEDIERAWRPKAFREVEYAVEVTETNAKGSSLIDEDVLQLPSSGSEVDIKKQTFAGSARRASQCITDGIMKPDETGITQDTINSGINTTVFLRRRSVAAQPEPDIYAMKRLLSAKSSTLSNINTTSITDTQNPLVLSHSGSHVSDSKQPYQEKQFVSVRRRRESVQEDICLSNHTLAKIDLVMEDVCGVADVDTLQSDDGQYKVDEKIIRIMNDRLQDVSEQTEYELASGVSVSFTSQAHTQSKKHVLAFPKPQSNVENVYLSKEHINKALPTPNSTTRVSNTQRTRIQRTPFHFDPLTASTFSTSGYVQRGCDSEVILERKNQQIRQTLKQAGYTDVADSTLPIPVDTVRKQKSRNVHNPYQKPHFSSISHQIVVKGIDNETVTQRMYLDIAEKAETEEEVKLAMLQQHGHLGRYGEQRTRKSVRKALKKAEDAEYGLLGPGAVHAIGIREYPEEDNHVNTHQIEQNTHLNMTSVIHTSTNRSKSMVEVAKDRLQENQVVLKGTRRFAKLYFLLQNINAKQAKQTSMHKKHERMRRKRLVVAKEEVKRVVGPTTKMWDALLFNRRKAAGKMQNQVASHALSVAIDKTLESNPVVAASSLNPVMNQDHNADFNVFNFYKSPEEILHLLQRIAGTVPQYTFDRMCDRMISRLSYKNSQFLRKQQGTRIMQTNRRVAAGQDKVETMQVPEVLEVEQALQFAFGAPVHSVFEHTDVLTASKETVYSSAFAVGPQIGETHALSAVARCLRGLLKETSQCELVYHWSRQQASEVISTLYALRNTTSTVSTQRQSLPSLHVHVPNNDSDSDSENGINFFMKPSLEAKAAGSIMDALQDLNLSQDFYTVNLPDIVELPNADPKATDMFNAPRVYCSACLEQMNKGVTETMGESFVSLQNSNNTQFHNNDGVLEVFDALMRRVPRLDMTKYWNPVHSTVCKCGDSHNIYKILEDIKQMEQLMMQEGSITPEPTNTPIPGQYINNDGSVDPTAVEMLRVVMKHAGEDMIYTSPDNIVQISVVEQQQAANLLEQEKNTPKYVTELVNTYRQYKEQHILSSSWTWLQNSMVEGLSFVLASYQDRKQQQWAVDGDSQNFVIAFQNAFGTMLPDANGTTTTLKRTGTSKRNTKQKTQQEQQAQLLLNTASVDEQMQTLQGVVHEEVLQRASIATEEGAQRALTTHGLLGSWKMCRQYSKMLIDVTAKHVQTSPPPQPVPKVKSGYHNSNFHKTSHPCICDRVVHVPMISALLSSVNEATEIMAKQTLLPEALQHTMYEKQKATKSMMTSLHDHAATLAYLSKNRQVEPILHTDSACPQYIDWKPPNELQRLLHDYSHIEKVVLDTIESLLHAYRRRSLTEPLPMKPLIDFKGMANFHSVPSHLYNSSLGAWVGFNLVSVVLRGLQEILATSDLVQSIYKLHDPIHNTKKKGVYWPIKDAQPVGPSTFSEVTSFPIEPQDLPDIQRTCMLCLYHVIPRVKRLLQKHTDLLVHSVDTDMVPMKQSFALTDYSIITDGALVQKPFADVHQKRGSMMGSKDNDDVVIPDSTTPTVQIDSSDNTKTKEMMYVRLHRPTLLSVVRAVLTNVKTSQLAVLKKHTDSVTAARLVVAPTSMLVPYVAGTRIALTKSKKDASSNNNTNDSTSNNTNTTTNLARSEVHEYLSSLESRHQEQQVPDIVGQVGAYDITVSKNDRKKLDAAVMSQNVLHGRKMQGELDVYYKYISHSNKPDNDWQPQVPTTSTETEAGVHEYLDHWALNSKNIVEAKYTTFHTSTMTHVIHPPPQAAVIQNVNIPQQDLQLASPSAIKMFQTPATPVHNMNNTNDDSHENENKSWMSNSLQFIGSPRPSISATSQRSSISSPNMISTKSRVSSAASIGSPRVTSARSSSSTSNSPVNNNTTNTTNNHSGLAHSRKNHLASPKNNLASPRDTLESPRNSKKPTSQWLVQHQKRMKNETMQRSGYERTLPNSSSNALLPTPMTPMLHTDSTQSLPIELPIEIVIPARKLTSKKVSYLLDPASLKTHPYAHMFLSDRLTEDIRNQGTSSVLHTSTVQPDLDLANEYVHDQQQSVAVPMKDVEVMRDVGPEIQKDIATIQASKVAGMHNMNANRLGTRMDKDAIELDYKRTKPVKQETRQIIEEQTILSLLQKNSDVEMEAFLSNIHEQFQKNKSLNSYAQQGNVEIPQEQLTHEERNKRSAYSYKDGIQRRGSVVLNDTHNNTNNTQRNKSRRASVAIHNVMASPRSINNHPVHSDNSKTVNKSQSPQRRASTFSTLSSPLYSKRSPSFSTHNNISSSVKGSASNNTTNATNSTSMQQARALQMKYGGDEASIYMRAATKSIRMATVSKHNPNNRINVNLDK